MHFRYCRGITDSCTLARGMTDRCTLERDITDRCTLDKKVTDACTSDSFLYDCVHLRMVSGIDSASPFRTKSQLYAL